MHGQFSQIFRYHKLKLIILLHPKLLIFIETSEPELQRYKVRSINVDKTCILNQAANFQLGNISFVKSIKSKEINP